MVGIDLLCGLSFHGQLDCSGRVSNAQYGRCDINESAGITGGAFCNPIMKA